MSTPTQVKSRSKHQTLYSNVSRMLFVTGVAEQAQHVQSWSNLVMQAPWPLLRPPLTVSFSRSHPRL